MYVIFKQDIDSSVEHIGFTIENPSDFVELLNSQLRSSKSLFSERIKYRGKILDEIKERANFKNHVHRVECVQDAQSNYLGEMMDSWDDKNLSHLHRWVRETISSNDYSLFDIVRWKK